MVRLLSPCLFVCLFVRVFVHHFRERYRKSVLKEPINQPEDVFSRGWGFKFCYLDKKERSLDGAFTLTDVARWIACSILVLLTSGISHHPSRVFYGLSDFISGQVSLWYLCVSIQNEYRLLVLINCTITFGRTSSVCT